MVTNRLPDPNNDLIKEEKEEKKFANKNKYNDLKSGTEAQSLR